MDRDNDGLIREVKELLMMGLTVMVGNFDIFHYMVVLHNSGFFNRCITKRCLNNSINVSYDDFVSQLLYDER